MARRLSQLARLPVTELTGVGPKAAQGLAEAFDVETVLDLLTHYPRRWIDRTNEAPIRDLRVGDQAYETYWNTGRGTEAVAWSYHLMDLSVFGRQETWEDSPEGWPQTPTFGWMRHHDRYDNSMPAHSCCGS